MGNIKIIGCVILCLADMSRLTSCTINPEGRKEYVFSLGPFYLEEMANVEFHIYSNLTQIANQLVESELPSQLFDYINDYKESSGFPGASGNKFVYNPITIFRMIWRFVMYISPLRDYTVSNSNQKIFSSLKQTLAEPDHIEFPAKMEDLHDVAERMGTMQMLFDLKPKSIMTGIFGEIKTGLNITFRQAMFLVSAFLEFEYFTICHEWISFLMNETVQALPESEQFESLSILQEMETMLVQNHDERLPELLEQRSIYTFTTPIQNSSFLQLSLEKEIQEWVIFAKDSGMARERTARTIALCRNSSLLLKSEPASFKKFKCFLHIPNTYFTLQPLKLEIFSEFPKISMYHGVLRQNVISKIEMAAKPELLLAGRRKDGFPVSCKIPKESLFPLNTLKTLEKVVDLHLLGDASENFYQAAYSFADFRPPHHDTYLGTEIFDNTATLLFYLDHAPFMGQIVFPGITLMIKPEIGSMLFWENRRRNGAVNWDMYHGTCPSVLQRKLITALFVGFTKNSFVKRKCSLNPEE